MPFYPPEIPYEMTRQRTRASAMKGPRLTPWAKERPLASSYYIIHI